jgi:superfamily II DNA/RNA helicase
VPACRREKVTPLTTHDATQHLDAADGDPAAAEIPEAPDTEPSPELDAATAAQPDEPAAAPVVPTFAELGVLPSLVEALERTGIISPFPIQELTIPVALTGTDMIGQARTGTGKTLAFGLPLLQRTVAPDEPGYVDVVEAGKPQALVVVPTRELAIQVAGDLQTASSVRRVRVLTVYGGRAYEPQVAALRAGVDVVVGTPGRLLDLAQQGELDLSHVKVLVLDEADEMLDLGFLPDVERIIDRTHELRQTMLFSATMPAAVVTLARRYLRHPVNVRAQGADESQTVPTTAQFVYRAHQLDKDELVARILQAENRGLTMVFARTKRQAQRLADELSDRGFAVASSHGDLGQGAREQALRAFRSGKVDVLVATDVAARGIDVEGVTHVVNLSCPDDEKTYLHRIGRTGRAGASGVAVTLVDWEDLGRWRMINDALGLPYPEPAETYSSSPHFYHDLGIPTEVKGVLPKAQRTRAGLAAEELEDLGETGRGGRSRGGRPSGQSSGGRDSRGRGRSGGGRSSRGAGSAAAGGGGTASSGARRTSSSPRGDAAAAGTTAGGDTAGGAEGQPARQRQRRRRRRGGSSDGAAPEAAGA